MRFVSTVTCLAIFTVFSTAQSVTPASHYGHIPRALELSSSDHSLPDFGFYDEPQCDQDGNLFFHMNTGRYNDSIILRLSPTAQRSTLLKVSDEYSSTTFSAFTVTPSGTLRVLAEDKEGYFVFDFDADGDMTRHTRIALPEHPTISQFASLDSGLTLLAGFVSKRTPADAGKNVIAIFDSSGRLVRNVKYPHKFDLNVEDDLTIKQGFAVGAKDGNFYLLLADKILVISPAGQIQRKITFDHPDPKSFVTKLFVSDGTLGIIHRIVNPKNGNVKTFLSVLYADTGEEIGYYVLPDGSTGHVLCYSRKEGLAVFGYENKTFILMNAQLK